MKSLFFDSLRTRSSCEDGGLREDNPPKRTVVNQTLSLHAPNSMTDGDGYGEIRRALRMCAMRFSGVRGLEEAPTGGGEAGQYKSSLNSPRTWSGPQWRMAARFELRALGSQCTAAAAPSVRPTHFDNRVQLCAHMS